MAQYNTFMVVDCKSKKNLLVTSSARKAFKMLETGKRIDVWNENLKTETVYFSKKGKMTAYLSAEKDYIRKKQRKAERRNRNNVAKTQCRVWHNF